MKNVGVRCGFLKASVALKTSLIAIGNKEHFAADEFLFHEDDENAGVFLLVRGKVMMNVRSLPKLDRIFSAGSVLGLPATFTGRSYSLSAIALTDAELVHVPAEAFLQLMRECPELCGETTGMLGREVTFIQSALAERRRLAAKNKIPLTEIGALI